jgi:Xaa-Pro aminopeptidase
MSALRRKLSRAGLSGLVVTHLADIHYLTGFTGSSAALAVAGRTARLFTDGRYKTQAEAEVSAAKVEIVGGSPAVSAVQWIAAQPNAKLTGFDGAVTTVAQLDSWKQALPSRLRRNFLTPLAAPIVPSLRTVKDEDEIECLAQAAALGCKLFDHIIGFIRPGLREIDVAAELEHRARVLGAEGMSFDTIAASGERSALPHGRASRATLPKRGFLMLDFGVLLNGYCSDMTRTLHLGSPKQEERGIYQAVLEAQEAAVAAVRPGVTCADVDEAARSVLRMYGLAEQFTHSTGHGVGLEIHEQPRVGVGQKTRLEEGMVITIEPGVYLPGRFGIRIEDTVVVEREQARILTPSPKALIEL